MVILRNGYKIIGDNFLSIQTRNETDVALDIFLIKPMFFLMALRILVQKTKTKYRKCQSLSSDGPKHVLHNFNLSRQKHVLQNYERMANIPLKPRMPQTKPKMMPSICLIQ
ncbi:hypothetical protein BpHYR1_006939 [Brachionus plicatilis]|uniref:Uncharacterized protein n=1 Tax=Brachionus plicatilis TaxID=10195 RepID=A0A3M7SG33_BRAPC|nr:hypothetical protein BpHYR1_006939 [Brachionus plicatilis]